MGHDFSLTHPFNPPVTPNQLAEDAIEAEIDNKQPHSETDQRTLLDAFSVYIMMLRNWPAQGPEAAATVFFQLKALPWVLWTDTMQVCASFVPGRRNTPFWDTSKVPFVAALEASADAIRQELDAFLADNVNSLKLESDFILVTKGSWTEYILWMDGEFNVAHCAQFPVACRTVANFPLVTGWEKDAKEYTLQGQVTFMRVTPGTHLRPHTGQINNRLTVQLPLIVPEGVSIRVANTTRNYTQGKVIIFDDSYEHEVKHEGASGDRYVLYMTAHHPDLPLVLENHNYAPALRSVRDMSYTIKRLRNQIASLQARLTQAEKGGASDSHDEL